MFYGLRYTTVTSGAGCDTERLELDVEDENIGALLLL
jgi:hypothetical protein